MKKLLQAVLAGDWSVECAVRWISGGPSALPPADLIDAAAKTAWKVDPPTPDAFRTFVLNYVRDQAQYILNAAQDKVSASRIGTPQTATKKSVGGTDFSLSSSRKSVEHLRSLESVARRLEPGALDDTQMFPSLGAADNTRKQGGKDVILPGAKSSSASAGPSGNRRRIQPTQVAQIEASKQFVTALTSQKSAAGKLLLIIEGIWW